MDTQKILDNVLNGGTPTAEQFMAVCDEQRKETDETLAEQIYACEAYVWDFNREIITGYYDYVYEVGQDLLTAKNHLLDVQEFSDDYTEDEKEEVQLELEDATEKDDACYLVDFDLSKWTYKQWDDFMDDFGNVKITTPSYKNELIFNIDTDIFSIHQVDQDVLNMWLALPYEVKQHLARFDGRVIWKRAKN